jgi:hypothetical protein
MTTQILGWFIMNYGLMNIMVYGSIFNDLRNKIKVIGEAGFPWISPIFNFVSGILSCPMCFSTWSGFLLSYLIYSPSHQLFGITEHVSWFFDGLMSSGAVWIINSIIEWFEENRPNQNNHL